jgi:soluble lytic murein transglycosylase-like protein
MGCIRDPLARARGRCDRSDRLGEDARQQAHARKPQRDHERRHADEREHVPAATDHLTSVAPLVRAGNRSCARSRYHRIVGLRVLLPLALVPALVLAAPARTSSVAPVEEWTERFAALVEARNGEALDRELAAIRAERPDLYDRFFLAHLQGRARLMTPDYAGAFAAWVPLAAPGHPLRDLALYYQARAAEGLGAHDQAARLREELVFGDAGGPYAADAVAEHAAALVASRDAEALASFAERLGSRASRATRRRLDADLCGLLVERGETARGVAIGQRLLRENAGDDAADRAAIALDTPAALALLTADDRVRVGESARIHRRFGRAVALLGATVSELPARRDELLFSIGRSHYFAEDFAAAQRTYVQGASTADAEARARFLYHAARAAQLAGDDKGAETLLLRALGAAPRPPARTARGRRSAPSAEAPRACLVRVQLVRLYASQKRFDAALPQLAALRGARCPGELGEATVAFASAAIVAGHPRSAHAALVASPPAGVSRAEGEYWSARVLETLDPRRAVDAHLALLRPATVSPFARFAAARLEGPLSRAAGQRAAALPAAAAAARARGDLAGARRLLTDAVLLAPAASRDEALARLRAAYGDAPGYAAGLDLRPLTPPRLSADPARTFSRTETLLALGLFDDAADGVPALYAGSGAEATLTRAELLRRGTRARASIRAAEQVVGALPSDYLPELLPVDVRGLLYPRHYAGRIGEDARRFGADPDLVLAIMREESRFDTRARSAAAARGLLQIVLTTAREVGRSLGMTEIEGEDLYDPERVIPLGSKYLGDLQRDFDGNLLKAAAAYNAGPRQVVLWSRLAPSAADDAFFASISFAETRRYVAQVLASYDRYREWPDERARTGGGARAR